MSIRPLLLWFPMIIIAFVNATLRELVFIRHYSEYRSHQLSTITLIVFCAVYIGLVFPLLGVKNSRQAFLIGLMWVLLTVVFEFSLGRLTNKSWAYLLQDYNLSAGRIWLVFLFCLFLLPYLFYSLRSK